MNRKTPARRSGRQPKQDRSRTSLRRLLETAESMLASDGYAQFTLQALSKRAKVSIGSIYNLFESKQALVRDLQVRFLERVERVHAQVINDLRRNNLPLKRLVPTAVRDYGEYLRDHAELLRVFMEIRLRPSCPRRAKRRSVDEDFELLRSTGATTYAIQTQSMPSQEATR
jgi:AcrR family transcriptional regulator